MKHFLLCFLVLGPLHLQAQAVTPDSLLVLIRDKQADKALQWLDPEKPRMDKSNLYRDPVLMTVAILAYYAKGDSVQCRSLREHFLSKSWSQPEIESVLTFLFVRSGKFITSPPSFFYIQDLAIAFSERHQEARAEFAFLQQEFSMYQMMGQPQKVGEILHRMRRLSRQTTYLDYYTDMQYGLYYAGIQHDSCEYYFEKFLTASPTWLGYDDPHFLYRGGFGPRKDSSIVASTIREYAMYTMRKGDLKKAGELLITSYRLVPDTSRFGILKIQNQLTLSTLYTDLINPSRAIHYCLEAIALCDRYAFQRLRKTRVAAAYAYALMGNGQYDEAVPELEMAFREFPRGINPHEVKRQALRRSLLATYQEDFPTARIWMDSASHLPDTDDHEVRFLETLIKGAFDCHQGRHATAVQHFKEAENIARRSNSVGWRKDALHLMYQCEKQGQLIREGLLTLESLSRLSDSLYRTGQDVALFDIEAGYQKSLQDETIARLDAQNTTNEARLTAQKRFLMLILIGLLVVCVLLTLLWRMYQRIKTSNAIITKAMEEKNILLKEIHHRVKNNLQVISSLLKLQSGYIKDDAAIQAIAEGRSRVQSMALLHQNLYREDNLTGVNMNEYFENLIQGLFDTYNISPDRIQLHTNIAPISLDVDTVVPLGLVTNELISNALKHAFPGNANGNLYVELYEEGPHLILKVRDDGTGLSASTTSHGFGSKLIQSLSQKLEADITTRTMNGTEVILTIREYRKAA